LTKLPFTPKEIKYYVWIERLPKLYQLQ
jgi:hypothetical protein